MNLNRFISKYNNNLEQAKTLSGNSTERHPLAFQKYRFQTKSLSTHYILQQQVYKQLVFSQAESLPSYNTGQRPVHISKLSHQAKGLTQNKRTLIISSNI